MNEFNSGSPVHVSTAEECSAVDCKSLLDGAYPIVEIFEPESPAQIEWKRKWLINANKIISEE